jgi:HK97 family phage major capsid protein
MSDELNNLENVVHEYRKTLDGFAARTGAQTHQVERRGSGEEREKIARIDADLDMVERLAQERSARRAAEDRAAEFEARLAAPQFKAAVSRNAVEDRSSAEYAQRWLSAVARGDAAEMRVLSTGTTSAGIPTDMERRIVERMYQASILRQLAKVTTIDSKRTITIEGDLPSSALVAEQGAVSASDPTFEQVSVTPYKFVCANTMSQEFIEDAIGTGGVGSGLQYVADRCGVSLAKIMDQYYTVGTGASQPQGIGDTSSTNWNNGAGSGAINVGRIIRQGVALADDGAISTITGDNIIDCVHAVPPQYRTGNFRILTSDTCIKNIRKLKVNSTDYIWKINETAGISGGNPGTILGIPYYVGEYVATTQSAITGNDVRGNAYFIAGNFDYFEIFDRTGMTSMIDPYSGAANQRSTLYVTVRTDSRIMQPEAFATIYAVNTA